MNKNLKSFCMTLVICQGLVCLYEVYHAYVCKVPAYLQDYNWTSNFSNHIKKVCLRFLHIFIYYLIIQLVDYKLPFHKMEASSEEDNGIYLSDENNPLEIWIFNNKTIIVVYLYFLTLISNIDIVLILFVPFLQYKLLVYLYNRHKYYKIFIYSFVIDLCQAFYKILFVSMMRKKFLNLEILPIEIANFLIKKNFKILIIKFDHQKYNVGVASIWDQVTILIFGDIIEKITKKEFISILYHEIGHIVNKSHLFHLLVSKSAKLSLYIIEGIAIFYNHKLLRQTYSGNPVRNLILLFILIHVTILPVIQTFINYYGMVDEIEADRFSTKMANKGHLITGLVKLTFLNGRYHDMSRLYALMYYDHPSLEHRVHLINQF